MKNINPKYNWYKKSQLAINFVQPVQPVQLVQPISAKPEKTFLETEREILLKSGIPKSELADYISDTLADGAILKEKAREVQIGKLSPEEAAQSISQDWENKKTLKGQ